jgi:hypothetical protein
MFQKAERKRAKLKIGLTGPSGSGKTYSGLLLAKGIASKIAVIDTENGSASLYADRFNFDVIDLTPPFTTEKYIDAIKLAEKEKYEIVLIDSISHAWAGEGGLLEQKEQLDSRGRGNSYTNWADITKKHEKFKAALLHADIHLIATMRSKQDYVVSPDDKGKMTPKKVGLAPIQRDGMEYEFTTVFDIAMNHEAEASKDRTGLFTDKIFKITEETGQQFKQWLLTAAIPKPSTQQLDTLYKIVKTQEWPAEEISKLIEMKTGKTSSKELNIEEYTIVLEYLLKNPKKKDSSEKPLQDEMSQV